MTIRDLTGSPEIEAMELQDVGADSGLLPGYDSYQRYIDGEITEADLDALWAREQQENEDRAREQAARLMAAFDTLTAALRAAGEAEGYGRRIPEVA